MGDPQQGASDTAGQFVLQIAQGLLSSGCIFQTGPNAHPNAQDSSPEDTRALSQANPLTCRLYSELGAAGR